MWQLSLFPSSMKFKSTIPSRHPSILSGLSGIVTSQMSLKPIDDSRQLELLIPTTDSEKFESLEKSTVMTHRLEAPAGSLELSEAEARRLVSLAMTQLHAIRKRSGLNETERSLLAKIEAFRREHRGSL